MKKLFAMAVALFTATAMFAQPEAGTLTLQPKAGIAIASSSADGSKSKVGFVGGVEAGYQICNPFAVTVGVNYAQYGAKAKNGDMKVNLDYITVPILANYYVVPGLAVKAGIEPAFKVSSSYSGGLYDDLNDYLNQYRDQLGGYFDQIEEVYTDMPDMNAKSFMLSIPVGVSYEYKNVVLDARYNIGVTDLLDGSDAKGSAFVITLGYKFAL